MSSPAPWMGEPQLDNDSLPMIGGVGVTFISNVLISASPQDAIDLIHRRGALTPPDCAPMLELADQLGVSRADAHKYILQHASKALLEGIRNMDKLKVEDLLNDSFDFLGIPELRDVPITCMSSLVAIPAQRLKDLSADKEVFKILPARVQRQVWEYDKKLLQQHALPLVAGYMYETATLMRALNMAEFFPHPMDAQSATATPPTRKTLRRGSAALQQLKDMIGQSEKIYKNIIELCVVRFRDSDALYAGLREASCAGLRAQLLMALHDEGGSTQRVAERDKCHQLAWTLDACAMHRRLSEDHLRILQKYFADFQGPAERRKSGHRARKDDDFDDAESAGCVSGMGYVDPRQVLGEVGMVLQDPSSNHLLLHEVLQQLRRCWQEEQLPHANQTLAFLTQMLQLGADCRQMLRERRYYFPDPPAELMKQLYPWLIHYLGWAEFITMDLGDPRPSLEQPHMVDVIEVMAHNEVARKVVQLLVLQLLRTQSLRPALALLRAVAHNIRVSLKSVNELAPFGASLAQQLASSLKAGSLEPQGELWRVAVEAVLLKAVDADTQVHEEVLRLLLAAASKLEPAQLASYLQQALDNSKRSRKIHTKKRRREWAEFGAHTGYSSGAVGASGASDPGSDIIPGVFELKQKGADGVKGIYQMFLDQVPALTADVAPALHAYLAPTEQPIAS